MIQKLILVFILMTPVVMGGESLDLTINNYGFGFGNSAGLNGIRLNLVDKDVLKVNGINLSLGSESDNNPFFEMNGLSVGVIGLNAYKINGIAFSGGILTADKTTGAAIGGLGVDGERFNGISLGGLYVGCDKLTGIGIGGGENHFLRNDFRQAVLCPIKPFIVFIWHWVSMVGTGSSLAAKSNRKKKSSC